MFPHFPRICFNIKVREKSIKGFGKFLRVLVLVAFVLSSGGKVWGQTTYYWRTAAGSGTWSTAGNWSTIGPGGGAAATAPGNANTDIAIFDGISGVTATISAATTIGKLQVTNSSSVVLNASGNNRTLTLNTNATNTLLISSNSRLEITGLTNRRLTLTFANGVNSRQTLDGYFDISVGGTSSGLFNQNNALLTFSATGTYEHAIDAGTIPTATWNITSTCNITGIIGTAPAGLNQSFGNFTWNCAGQTGTPAFAGALQTINGDFTVLNTNIGRIDLGTTGYTLTIGGNFTLGNGTNTVTMRTSTTNGAATNTINLYGDFTMQANTSFNTRNNGNILNFNFAKTGIQTYNNTGGIIPANLFNFTVNSGAVLDMGSSVLDGSTGTFTLSSGAGIITKHAEGISTTAGTGCIQVTGAKTFNSGADYTYNSTIANQATGNGLPVTVRNLTIGNTAANGTVNQTNNTTVNGTLTLSNGILSLGANTITLANGANLAGNAPNATNMVATGTGQFIKYFPAGDSPAFTFPVGDVTGTAEYSPVTLDFSANTIAGTVGVSVTNAVHGSINVGGTSTDYLSRYWTFTTSGLTAYSYNASTYQYNFSDITGTETIMKLSYWNGAAWTSIANSSAGGNALTISSPLTQATGPLTGNAFTGRYVMPTFYSSGNNDPSNVNNWWSNTNGTGSHPANFTSNNQKFVIQNGHNMTTGAGWTVSGTNTIVNIQNGGTLTETIPVSISATTTLQVDDGGTVNHNVNSLSIFSGTEAFGANSTINYGFAGTQSVIVSGYGNLTISGSGTKTLQGIITPAGNLSIAGSTFDLGLFTADRSIAGGSLSLDATASLLIGGTNTFPANYTVNTLVAGSLVNYNGTSQVVDNITYSNLTISGSGIKTLGGNADVNNLLTLTSGTLAVAGNTLTLNGPAIAGTPNNLSTTVASTLVFGGSSLGITIPSSVALLNNLTIGNVNGVSLSGALSALTLTFNSGVLNTTATNLLTITNPATGSIGGASLSNYVNGPLARTLLPGIAVNGTTYTFPVGDGANYRPLDLIDIRTGGVAPVVMVSENGTGALNGDETTITSVAPRNWLVNPVSGNLTSAFIQLTESLSFTSTIGKSTAQAGIYSSVGGNIIGLATITTPLAIAGATMPAYFAIGTSVIKTFYSYQSGDWKLANTWTLDPSGTLWISAGVPGTGDNVVILNGRTVTVNENTKTCLSLEIKQGGNLDLLGTNSHDFGVVTGQGTLRLSSGNFPAGTYTDFVSSDGGTVEYYNYNGPMAGQGVYNNLIISNTTASANVIVLPNPSNPTNYTINGDLTVQNSGLGTQTFTLGSLATNVINLTEWGNVNVGSGCNVRVGNVNAIHNINLYGNFTNNGSVRFTNQASPVALAYYTAGATNSGAAIVTFMGGTDNSLTCNGVTDFYRLILDKGSDQTYILDVTSNNVANFALYAPNNQGGNQFDCGLNCFGTGVYLKALYVAHGTLKLNDNISIPSLTEGGQDFNILPPAAIWVNGANVSTTVVGQNGTGYQAATLYGKLRVSAGTFSTGDAAGIVLGQSGTPDIIVEGSGVLDVSQVWTSNGSNIMSYTQTGGTTNIRANAEPHAAPMLSLTSANCVFSMSGGTLNFTNAIFSGTQVLDIRISQGKYLVTGGTVNINYPGGVTADINSTIPFYNLNVSRQSGGGVTTARFLNTSSTNITVLNNLTLNANTTLDAGTNNVGLTVGKDFTMDATSTYNCGTNTTTFNGVAGQRFTNAGAITGGTGGLNNLVITGSSNTDIFSNNMILRGSLTLDPGCFINDVGHSISISGNVSNSGTHTSTGTGAIIINGTGAQAIGGSGNGIFGNLTINKTAGTSAFSSNQSITGNLRLVSGILNIDRYNLALSANSNIYDVLAGTPAPSTFGNAKMIITSGQQSDGGLTKTFDATGSFLFPLGTGAAYHPGTITFSQAPATWGDVTVRPVSRAHPFAITGNQVLLYYWKVTSSISGIPAGSVSHTYHYVPADATALENTYITGIYNPYSWTAGAAAQVDKIGKNILFPAVSILDGDYTAGVPAAFAAVKVFYSHHSGDWNTQSTWSNVDNNPLSADATTFPGPNDPVVIGDGTGNNHVVTISANNKVVGGLQISTGSTLDIKATTGHNFGSLPDLKIAGTGTLRISSGVTPAAFPSGDFGNFLGPNGGTVEYYTETAPAIIGVAYTLPTSYVSGVTTINILNYSNLVLSPATLKNITLPNTDLVIYKDLNINVSGTSATGIAQLNNQNTTRTVTINGNLNINKGNLQYTNGGNTAQNLVVSGDVNVLNGAVFNVANANSATNTLSIQGNLTNNGTFDMLTTAARNCNVTFMGSENKQINGTTAVQTDFNVLTVNKGIDRNSILETTVNAFSLNTLLPSSLTLTNGTFRLSTPLTITLTTTSQFTIPNSGCLSANIGTINIGAANGNAYDLMLYGRLEVMNSGIVKIGNNGGSNNDIEYGAAGNPEINVSGGSLNVDGQIRRNTSNTLGSLWFNQSGGTITVKGRSVDPSRGMFEVVNSGSQFNVSGGNLIIENAGSTAFAEVYITPESSNVNGSNGGHTLTIGDGTTPAAQNFDLNISTPLWNLTIDGTTTNKTASLSVNTLSILNNLTINGNGTAGTGSVFKANDLDVSIGGSLTNNNLSATLGADQGGYQSGAAGSTQNTTFFGTGQINGTGANLTNFANLIIGSGSTNPFITLGSNSKLQINNNLILNSGTLSDAGNLITVLGDIQNSATHASPVAPGGGIVMANGNKQILSGNGNGRYGNISINNATGVDMTCNNIISGQLSLAGGLLYIDDYKLTMDVNASFIGPYDGNHMVELNGVLSDAGVVKLFSGSTANFVFPIGSNGKYRPAKYTFTSADAGSIKVVPVSMAHPADNAPGNDQLNYYWKTSLTGFSGLTSSTQVYQYGSAEVAGNENNYHGALYNNFAWSDYGTTVINPVAHTITITRSDLLGGEYTAGEVANFINVHKLYSLKTGNWNDPTVWANDLPTNPACNCTPNGNPVFIQPGHKITMNINNAYAYSVNIEGTFDLGVTSFHNLGYIIDTLHAGTGRMMLQATADGMFLFPGGNYNAFMMSPGTTVEFYGATNATLPLKPGNIYKPYQNVEFTGTGIKYMSAENLKISGNLTINDGAKLNNTLFNKSLYILGNWIDKNSTSGGFVPGTGLTSFEGVSAQTLTVVNAGITENYYDFRIDNPLGLTLAGNGKVQVSDKLYLNMGAITTNATNTLTLTNSSTSAVVGGSVNSFVNGPLHKQITNGSFFTFPVGKSGSPSRYGNVYIFNITNTGIWQAEYFNNDPTANVPSLDKNSKKLPISHVSSNEYWRIIGAAGGSGNVRLRWDANSGYAGSSVATRSKIRVVEWNPSGIPAAQWEYRGKVLNDGGPGSGTVTTDNSISLAPGANIHYLTIGDEGLPTATITSPLTASVCNDAITSATITVALTGTPPWSLSYKLGTVTTTLNNIASSPVSIVLTSASSGITQPIAAPTIFNFNITNVNDLTGSPGISDYVTTVALTVNPVPSNTITGKTSVGTGEVVAYSTTSDANSYAWTLSSNGSLSAANTAICTVTWGIGTPGPYTLTLVKTSAIGCQSTNSIQVTTSTTPTPVITGNQYVCAGSTGVVYSTPLVALHDYTWTITPAGAGIITAGAGTNSIAVTWNGAASGNNVSVREHVTASGLPGTFTDASLPVDIGTQPSAIGPSYIAPASVCNGGTASITLNNSENNIRYQIRLNSDNSNNGTAVDGTGGTISLNTAAISASTTFNIYGYTLAPFNCTAQLSNPASTFSVNPLPVLNYGTLSSADQSICSGSTPNNIAFSTSPSGGAGTYSYAWYSYTGLAASCPTGTVIPAGWNLVAGATSDNYTPPALAASMTYAVMVTPTGSPLCGTKTWASGCRKVTVLAPPNASILSGTSSTCAGSTGDVFAVTNNASWTYSWSTEDNVGTVDAPGNTASVSIGWKDNAFIPPLATSTSVVKKVTATVNLNPSNGCATTLEWNVTIYRLPETGPSYYVPNSLNQ